MRGMEHCWVFKNQGNRDQERNVHFAKLLPSIARTVLLFLFIRLRQVLPSVYIFGNVINRKPSSQHSGLSKCTHEQLVCLESFYCRGVRRSSASPDTQGKPAGIVIFSTPTKCSRPCLMEIVPRSKYRRG